MAEQQPESNASDAFVPTAPPATSTTVAPPAGPTGADATRRWLVGAVLVTAGVVAGSGATYAPTAQANPAQGQFFNTQGGPGYGRMGGGPRDGGVPPGTTEGPGPQQDTAPATGPTTGPSGAPTTQTS